MTQDKAIHRGIILLCPKCHGDMYPTTAPRTYAVTFHCEKCDNKYLWSSGWREYKSQPKGTRKTR